MAAPTWELRGVGFPAVVAAGASPLGDTVDLLELVRLCCQGDALAWGTFLSKFQEIGRRVLRPYRLAESDCEDLLSEILEKLYRGDLRRFRGQTIGQVVNFLSALIRNKAIDMLKEKRREVPTAAPEEDEISFLEGPSGPPPRDPGSVLADEECQKFLIEEVKRLPPRDQELFFMKARGLKEREIAEQTGRPPGTISAQIARLWDRLRERLRERGCV